MSWDNCSPFTQEEESIIDQEIEDVMEINVGSDKQSATDESMNEQGLEGISNGYEEVQAPKTGMVFNSDDEAFDYYKNYGECEGFGVIRKSRKFDENKRLKYVTFSCAKSGRVKGTSSNSIRPKPSTKTDCKAKINMIVDDDGRYTVGYVKFDHNHALSPTKSRFLSCNMELSRHAERRLELNNQANISLSKTLNSFVVETRDCENLTFGEKECGNYIAKVRQLRLGVGDAEAIHEYFVRMQNKNSDFFYKMEFDDENRIRNVFWADARSRAAYESFGDVVTFDTTYLANKYDMPLALFVGVNHHGQSMLFGCGLLSNEDTETYVWLFRSWLECMRGRSPNAIIIDQCMAIQGAVTKVFSKARHRLCLWHIMKKIPVKLSGFAEYKKISNSMMSIICDSMTTADFEENWVKMIETYNLHHNEWLNSLYVDRHLWVPTFVKDTFWAGLSTTQPRESMNSFFDGYVNSKTTLKQFVEQYDNALRSKVEKENLANFASFNSNIPVITNFHIEKQFQEAYSIEIFKLFQDELQGLYYCNVSFVKVDEPIVTFQVRENVTVGDGYSRRLDIYNVLYNKVECEVKCICRLFEFKGILCRHAIAVLSDQCVKEIPSQYILDRWRKDIKRRYTYVRSSYDDPFTSEQIKWHDTLHEKFKELVEVAMESTEKCEMLSTILDAGKEKLVLNQSECESIKLLQDRFMSSLEHDGHCQGISYSSKRLPSPSSKRKESHVDRIISKRKKQVSQKEQSNRPKRKTLCEYTHIVVNKVGIPPNIQFTLDMTSEVANPTYHLSEDYPDVSITQSTLLQSPSEVYPMEDATIHNQSMTNFSFQQNMPGTPINDGSLTESGDKS